MQTPAPKIAQHPHRERRSSAGRMATQLAHMCRYVRVFPEALVGEIIRLSY